ncbi:MAG: hypothetical protein GEU78_15385 [Actinobacteria bacterium]|nr:hypothetical protein [Actinomycetota bacterium]
MTSAHGRQFNRYIRRSKCRDACAAGSKDGARLADIPYESLCPQVPLRDAWASRSQLPAFVKLARTVREHKVRIYAAVAHKLSNARVESLNTKPRLIMRRAFGFRSVDALIGLAMLAHGGLCPPLPGRATTA